MPTTITTSTAATATAYSNQRKIDRTSNGVLWAHYQGGTDNAFKFYYSTDNGATWNYPGNAEGQGGLIDGGVSTYTRNLSFFIDQDDYAHVVYKYGGDGYIYYRRGTPNAGRTAWTWSAATNFSSSVDVYDYPDVVAHREGTGWVVHAVASRANTSTVDRAHYGRVTIDAAGTIAVPVPVGFEALSGSAHGNTNHKYPSIDFNHTGDGKTVAGGTPHLYVAWSAGATGAGKGIRFKKATYSGGTWTWGTEQEIDNSRYVYDSAFYAICMFDGTRVVIPSAVYNGTQSHILIYERDAADTTTITRSIITDRHAGASSEPDGQFAGSATYDASGNVYIVGRDSGASRRVQWRKWNRSTLSAETPVVFDTIAASVAVYASVKRGYSNNRAEFIYTDGTASPYNITYDSIALNQAPSVTLASPGTVNPRAAKTISWTFSDPDAGNTQTAYELDYRVSGGTWVSLSTGTTASSYNVPANFFTDETNYEVRVRVSDGVAWSAYDIETFRADSWTYYPEGTVFTSTPAYADIVKADEPVGYWRLGENSGTVAVDSSGNGNNATYRSGVTLNSTPLINNDSNPATDVGSSSNGIATVPSKLGLDGRDETVELWVKTPASVTRGGFVYVGSSGYGIGLGSGSFDGDGWNLLGLFEVLRWIDTGYVMSPSTTYHVAMTLSASGFPTVFVNGAQVYADTAGAPQAPGGTGFIDIGHSGGRALQDGTLDEVAVYNRALTAAEIKRHYDAGIGKVSLHKASVDTTGLEPSEYEIQIRVSDQDDTGAWSATDTFILDTTKNFVYVNGEWVPVQKQFHWLGNWKYGEPINF